MAQTDVQRYYQTHASIYDITRWTMLHGRRRAVSRLEICPDSQVLEIGCGTGLNFRFLMEHLSREKGHLVGLDFSEEMLRRAARRIQTRGWKNIELIHGDATGLSLGRQFDAIYFGYSLSMIPDWAGALERAHAHLRPGGRLVVLDFGQFRGWGPLGAVVRWIQEGNHVDSRQPYEEKLRQLFGNVGVEHWLGGYNFTACSRKCSTV